MLLRDSSAPSSLFSDIAEAVLAGRRVPGATYRVQFGPHFSFRQALDAVGYLDSLGITDLYASPVLKPGRGSPHGYDICDHSSLNPILGTESDFDDLTAELRRRGMGLVFDLVPNHMGIADPENGWWMDVLENGPSSPYAPYFDIDWHPMKAEAQSENRVLLPVLGDAYGKVLENQELQLSYESGAFFVRYYARRMPVAPRQYADILSHNLANLTEVLHSDNPSILELQSIITAIHYLPLETETDVEKINERQREKEIIKQRIARLVESSPEVREAIENTVTFYNGRRGDRRSFDALHGLLDGQNYRLSFWRVAAEEINYRRFFDINDLAAIRIERPDVFLHTHQLVMRFVREGKVTGFRIDHADGLRDPVRYFRDLQRASFLARAQAVLREQAGDTPYAEVDVESALAAEYDARLQQDPLDPIGRSFFTVVEKILGNREALRLSWPVHGTTGYDFANSANGLFVNSGNRKALTELYESILRGRPEQYRNQVNSAKKIIMLVSLSSEVNELGFQLKRIAWKNRWYRDFTLNSLTHAVREVVAAFSVYRTYQSEDDMPIQLQDRAVIESAIGEAKRRNPRTAAAVFDFVQSVLLQKFPDDADDDVIAEWRNFVMRFQQTTGPVMAKGVEDTAFYAYNRLISLNEVGGNPEQFGISTSTFHQQNLDRLFSWPNAMLAESTHDSKRSADVRARLDVLSEIPRRWRGALARWSRLNRSKKTLNYGEQAPDRNDEYLLYQTLLGTWPLESLDSEGLERYRHRIQTYMQKAVREAKVHSSWVNPNPEYDYAVSAFVERVLVDRPDDKFLSDFFSLRDFVAYYGMLNSLAWRLVHLTAPGFPDLYQGSELWNFDLVDPDNRKPVDYSRPREYLAEIQAELDGAYDGRSDLVQRTLPERLLACWTDGRIKLYVTHVALRERRRHPDVYVEGRYVPLNVVGPGRDHIVGFARTGSNVDILTIVPRLSAGLTRESLGPLTGPDVWGDTKIQVCKPGRLLNLMTGDVLEPVDDANEPAVWAAQVFSTFPVALLRRESSGGT